MTIVKIIVAILIMSVVGFLCSFFIVANAFKDEFWEAIEEKEGGKDDRKRL